MSINERLARFMGWRDFTPHPHYPNLIAAIPPGKEGYAYFPAYDSDDSPRSVLAEVEAELERRGLWGDYVCELHKLIGEAPPEDYFGIGHSVWMRFKIATAPASVRAEAAARVIEKEATR